jgi:hypothetical protein
MSTDQENSTPVWRQALKDESHPLNRAAWMLFGQTFNAKVTAKLLRDQREQVIPFLLAILDDESLYYEGEPGGGHAPENAVELIMEWQVHETFPKLIEMYREFDLDDSIHSVVMQALEKLGKEHVPELLTLGKEFDSLSDQVMVAIMLGDCGTHDPEAYAWCRSLYTKVMTVQDEHDVEFIATALLQIGYDEALPFLENEVRQKRYNFSKRLQKVMPSILDDARKGIV